MSGSGFESEAALMDGVIGRRLLAWLIDTLLLAIVLGELALMLFFFGVLTLGLAMPLLGGLWIVPMLYTFGFTASARQATPGQKLAGLRVVRDDDLGRPTPAQALVFAVGYWLTMTAGVVWLAAALVTRRGRCLHDIASGLVIVPSVATWTGSQFRFQKGFGRGGFPSG